MVAAALALGAQQGVDPTEVLREARPKLATIVQRLPRYTCVQTVQRSYFRQGPRLQNATCEESVEWHRLAKRRLLELADRLRLEVAIEEGSEMYGWVGVRHFESTPLWDLVEGPIGTGAFGSFLVDVFGPAAPQFEYKGEEDVNGQSLLTYHFQVPQEASTYRFEARGKSWMTGYEGEFWLDRSGELWRLMVRITTPREDLGMCAADTSVDLHRVRIGTGDYLLPSASRFSVVGTGYETLNVTTFSACREYHGESVLHFDGASAVDGAEAPTTPTPGAEGAKLPAGLQVALALQDEINWNTAAAGDPIVVKVRKDITEGKPKRVLVLAGAIVRGRLTRVAHQVGPRAAYLVSISFETLENSGKIIPFSAKLDPHEDPLMKRYVVTVDQLAAEGPHGPVPGPKLPPDAEFSWGQTLVFQSADKNYVLKRGFESHWLTTDTVWPVRLR